MLINTIFNKVNQMNLCKLFFFSYQKAFGNNAEALYFALLKASKEKKKVYLLYPFDIPLLFGKKLGNELLFNLRSDFIYFQNPFLKFFTRLLVTILILPARCVNLFINIFGYTLPQDRVVPQIGDLDLWQVSKDTKEFSWERLGKYKWNERVDQKFQLDFSSKDYDEAQIYLKKLGISHESWFVCIHVREPGFYKDFGKKEYRNSNIEKYLPAIKEITKMGGIVVRLGDSSMSRLPKIDNVIDYPHTDCKSNLMDMYLIKYCKFYIATASGIFDAAILFGKEVLMTNSSCWIFPYALRIHDRTIIKHVYSKKHGRFLTLQERMSSDWSMQAIWSTIDKNYILFENSSDDIKNAVTEYLDIMHSGNFSLQECQLIANKKELKRLGRYSPNIV